MNQLRQSVIVKHDNQNQRNDELEQFYDSRTDSDGSFEDLISQDAAEFVAEQSDDRDDEVEAKKRRNAKLRRWRATKVDRDYEFETKKWLYEAAKQDMLEKKFVSGRACAEYYLLNASSLNKYIKNGTSFQQRGAASKVRTHSLILAAP